MGRSGHDVMDHSEAVRLAREIDTCLQQEDWHRALTLLGQWRNLQPDSARGWFNTGYCFVRLGRLDDAARALERSLGIDPDQANARQLLDHVHKLRGEPTDPDEESAADVTLHSHTRPQPDGPVGGTVPTASPPAERRDPKVTVTGSMGSHLQTRGSIGGTTLPTHTGSRVWTVGSVIAGRYEVRHSAHGGMGVVYICYDRELGRTVAVKTPLPTVLASERGRARFLREAEAWIGLGMHPNICTAYYLQEVGAIPRIFVEYIDGGSLDDWIKEERPLTLEQRLDIVIQIATGMHHTHSFTWSDEDGRQHTGLIHRDLKPANVLMGSDGSAHVTDFGLVRHTEAPEQVTRAESTDDSGSEADLGQLVRQLEGDGTSSGSWHTVTAAGSLMGTPPYMAPELWLGTRGPSAASDIYAFGCIAWELVCGRRPFQPADNDVISRESQLIGWMQAHTRAQPADPTILVPDLDPELARWLRVLIAKDPSRRPSTFLEIRRAAVALYERLLGAAYTRPMPRESVLLADSLNNRGVSYMALGQEDRARRTWSDTLKLDPHHIEATYNLALLEWKTYGISDAEIVRRMRSLHSEHGTTWRDEHLLGKLLLFLGDFERAADCLGNIEDRTPLDVRRDLGLAQAAVARRTSSSSRWQEAASTLQSVHSEDDADLRVLAALAAARREQGETESAAELWAQARSRSADLPETLAEAIRQFVPGHDHLCTLRVASPVVSMAIASDGQRLVARCGETELVVWRLYATGESPATVTVSTRLDDSARRSRALAVTADGSRAVVRSHDVPAAVWELEHGQHERRLVGHAGYATAIAVGANNRTALIGNTDRSVRLWDIVSGQSTRHVGNHESFVASVALTNDGAIAVSGGADGIRLWDLRTGADAQLLGHEGMVTSLAISPSGRWLASAGEDRTVRVWKLETREPIHTITGHQTAVQRVLWSADESIVVSCAPDRTVRLWDLPSGLPLRTLTFADPVHDIAMDGASTILAVAHGHLVELLHFEAQAAYRVPFATTLPVSTADLERRDQQFRQHLESARIAFEAQEWPTALKALEKARSVRGYEQDRAALRLWGQLLRLFPKRGLRSAAIFASLESTDHRIQEAAPSPDPSKVLTAGSDGRVRVWDLRNRVCAQVLSEHEGPVLAVATHPSEELAVSGGRNGVVCLWDIASGEQVRRLCAHNDAVRSVAFTARGDGLVSGSSDGSVLVWASHVDTPVMELDHGAPVISVATSADGRYSASAAADGSLHIWSLIAGRRVRTLSAGGTAVTQVTFSPDARRLAAAAADGKVRIWSLASGQLQRELDYHSGGATSVAWSPDATYLLSGDGEGIMRVWDRRSDQCLRECAGHTDSLVSVQFSHDGRFAVSASKDGALRFWILDWDPDVTSSPLAWQERARPFLEAFLHRQHAGGDDPAAFPVWDETDISGLLADLRRRGFGAADASSLESALERLLLKWTEKRARETAADARSQTITARAEASRPLWELVQRLTRNIGLKAAAVAVTALVLVFLYQSMRVPESDEALFNDTLRQEFFQTYQLTSRAFKHDSVFTGILSGGRARAVGLAVACDPNRFDEYLLALSEPGWHDVKQRTAGEYDAVVSCVLQFATPRHAPMILDGVSEDLTQTQRDDAVLVLVRLGDHVVPALQEALEDDDAATRHVAARALAYQRTERSLHALVDAVDSDDTDANEAASFVLRELIVSGTLRPEEALFTIQRLAFNIDPQVRRNAIAALTMFEETRPVRDLLDDALEDPDPEVRSAATTTRNALHDASSQSIREFLFGES